MAGEPVEEMDPQYIKYFHSALEKAPKSTAPFVAYAGISRERCKAVREACSTGSLSLNRIQSASANPAQVNGFMFQSDWKGEPDDVALEFKIDRVASLSAFNVHKHEMELLVPPGEYKVTGEAKQVNYFWGQSDSKRAKGQKSGRVAETTYFLEPAGDLW